MTSSLMTGTMWQTHLQQLADDAELGGVDGRPQGRAAIQRNLAGLEKWAGRNVTKFNKVKSKVLPLGRSNPGHQDMPWAHARGPFPAPPSRDSMIFWAHAQLKDPAARSMGWWDGSVDVNGEMWSISSAKQNLSREGRERDAEQLPWLPSISTTTSGCPGTGFGRGHLTK